MRTDRYMFPRQYIGRTVHEIYGKDKKGKDITIKLFILLNQIINQFSYSVVLTPFQVYAGIMPTIFLRSKYIDPFTGIKNK